MSKQAAHKAFETFHNRKGEVVKVKFPMPKNGLVKIGDEVATEYAVDRGDGPKLYRHELEPPYPARYVDPTGQDFYFARQKSSMTFDPELGLIENPHSLLVLNPVKKKKKKRSKKMGVLKGAKLAKWRRDHPKAGKRKRTSATKPKRRKYTRNPAPKTALARRRSRMKRPTGLEKIPVIGALYKEREMLVPLSLAGVANGLIATKLPVTWNRWYRLAASLGIAGLFGYAATMMKMKAKVVSAVVLGAAGGTIMAEGLKFAKDKLNMSGDTLQIDEYGALRELPSYTGSDAMGEWDSQTQGALNRLMTQGNRNPLSEMDRGAMNGLVQLNGLVNTGGGMDANTVSLSDAYDDNDAY